MSVCNYIPTYSYWNLLLALHSSLSIMTLYMTNADLESMIKIIFIKVDSSM